MLILNGIQIPKTVRLVGLFSGLKKSVLSKERKDFIFVICAGRKPSVCGFKSDRRVNQLPQIRLACHPASRFAGLLNGGQQKSRQNRND